MQFYHTQISIVYVLVGAAVFIGLLLVVVTLLLKRKRRPTSTLINGQISSEKLKSDIILSAIEDGVIVVATDGTIQVFNPGAAKITGWKTAETLGLDHRLVMKFLDEKGTAVDQKQNPIDQALSNKTAVRSDRLFIATRSGKQLPIGMAASPLLNADRSVSGVVMIFRDISREKTEAAQRAEFISTASHEMRTPVAAIEGYLALALNENVSKIDVKAREYLLKAHSSTQHLGKLFQDLLTSAKAEDGRLSSHAEVVEMGGYVEQLVEDLRFAADKKGLGIEFIIGTQDSTIDASNPNVKVVRPLYYVHVDPDRIREVVTNLFDNAVKYTESGKISVGITGDQQVVQLRIADTGPGIPPEDTPHLFEKFYRIDNSITRTVGGTGLGLFICRKVVELYDGRIWADSTVGKGSTFYVNLPRLSTAQATQLMATETTQSPLSNLASIK